MDFHLGLENLAQHAVDVGRRAGGFGLLGGIGQRRSGNLRVENADDLVFALDFGHRCNRCSGPRQGYVVGLLACTDTIGDGLHGLQVDADAVAMAQRRVQLRQRRMRVVDHRQHGGRCGAAAIQHAVEHAFDLPRELTQGACADQAATALEGMEDAADRAQPVHVVRLHAPCRQQRAEIGQLIVELFQEHLADVLVDVLGIVVETGVEARIGVGVGPGNGRIHRLRRCRSGHRLWIEAGSGRTQLGEELGVGLAEIDRRDGVDIDHRHGRSGRIRRRSRRIDQRRRDRRYRQVIRGLIHPGQRRNDGIDDLQRRMQRGVNVQRQRFHRMQRQHVVSVVQRVGIEAEHHVVGHGSRILFGRHRVEHRCSIESGRGGIHRVRPLIDHRRCAFLKHLRRPGQRPLRRTGVITLGQLEADRIETGEGRAALVIGRHDGVGLRM